MPNERAFDRPTRRKAMTTLLRAVATAAALVVLYYTLPFDGRLGGSDLLVLPFGLCVFVVLTGYEMRGIVRSPTPRARAIQVLATVVPFFVILYASTYYLMSRQSAGEFSATLTRTDALYFTVTVISTVGFGDIVPASEAARVVVMTQMIGDLVLIGAGLRLLTGAVRLGVERRTRETGREDVVPTAGERDPNR
jgi:hypothetical protein